MGRQRACHIHLVRRLRLIAVRCIGGYAPGGALPPLHCLHDVLTADEAGCFGDLRLARGLRLALDLDHGFRLVEARVDIGQVAGGLIGRAPVVFARRLLL